jgi:CRP-like cAMP-binding protein
MIGIARFLGSATVDQHAFVQVPGAALRIKSTSFESIVVKMPKLHSILARYTLALLGQIAQSAACNRVHDVDARCARWLLMTHDRVGEDSFQLTHEFLAQMLGVHRPTVSLAANMLQKAGLIRYARGLITITDRKNLERASCDCYRAIIDEYEKLLGHASAGRRN